jgi:OOP family OmpA-OmpF porin
MKAGISIALLGALMLAAPFAARSQAYVGAAVGQSKFEVENDAAAKVFGGYQFSPSFAIELGAHALGSTTVGNRSADFSAIDLSYFGTLILSKGVSVHGRIGVYRADITARGNDVGPTYGLGVGYALTRNAALRAEWQRFAKLGPGSEPEMNIDVLYLGASYRFGESGRP